MIIGCFIVVLILYCTIVEMINFCLMSKIIVFEEMFFYFLLLYMRY